MKMDASVYDDAINFIREFFMLDMDYIWILLGVFVLIMLVVHFGPKLVFRIYEDSTSEAIQVVITKFIYSLDLIADEMSNKQKRAMAIAKLQSLIIVRYIIIPHFVYGWIIDMLVQSIREEQAKCTKESNLHKGEDDI